MSRLSPTVQVGQRTIAVPVTITDQLVNWFSPTLGADRYRARLRMAISGGYTGADRTRRANQHGSRRETDADSAILPDLVALREESQHLVRNNAIAGGAIKTNITKVVGTGLKVKAQLDREVLGLTDTEADAWERAAEREFRLATETREIDAERQLPFSLLQGLAFLKTLEDGDVLVNLPRFRRPGSPYAIKIQLIESARVCNRDHQQDTATLCGGVKKDPSGAPVAYQVTDQHPGNWRMRARQKLTWTELPAFGKATGAPVAWLMYDKTRPGQTRGVPYLAPVVELLKQLGRYTDAEVMAAVVSGMLTVFVTNETGNPNIGPAPTAANPDSDADLTVDTTGLELGYGSVLGLMPGEKVETVNPGRPNTAFDPFVMAITRQIGVALELPYELLIKHFTASYSAARAALEEAWDYFSRRRHWLETVLCQPIYEAVITEAVAAGRLAAPGFFADPLRHRAWLGSVWTGDAPSQLDPVKEVEAAERRIAARLSTREEEAIRLTGQGMEDKLPRIIRENNLLRANHLLPETSASQSAVSDGSDSGQEKADVKEVADTYGVAVRAGAITPQQADESFFRNVIGLPALTAPVSDAWENDGGVRRPITLKAGDAFDAEAQATVDSEDGDSEDDDHATD